MYRIPVNRLGLNGQFVCMFPARKPSEDKSTMVEYASQGFAANPAELAVKIDKATSRKGLKYVPLSQPFALGVSSPTVSTAPLYMVGWLCDDEGAATVSGQEPLPFAEPTESESESAESESESAETPAPESPRKGRKTR